MVGDVTSTTENAPGDLAHFREILMKRRQEILDNQKPLADSMIDTNTRQGDLADQANGNNEVHIHLKLKQTDAKILIGHRRSAAAMEKGTYGRLPRLRRADRPARLEAIPWTRVCIACKEKQKA